MCSIRGGLRLLFVCLVSVSNFLIRPAAAKRSFWDKESDKDSQQHWIEDNRRDDKEDDDDDDDPDYTIHIVASVLSVSIAAITIICMCCICIKRRRRMRNQRNNDAANNLATTPVVPYFTDPKPEDLSVPFPNQSHRSNTEFLHPSPMQYYETESYQNPNGQFNEPPPPYSLVDEVQRIGQSSSDRPSAPPG